MDHKRTDGFLWYAAIQAEHPKANRKDGAKTLANQGRHSGGWAASLAEGDILWPLFKWN